MARKGRSRQPTAQHNAPVATDPLVIELDGKASRPEKGTLARLAAEASVQTTERPRAHSIPLVLLFANQADQIAKWWSPRRDVQLRDFWKNAPFLPGAIYSIASRNAAFRFELEGPDRMREWTKELYAHADLGGGWQRFIMKISQDLLSQDNGGFIEVIRPARIRTAEGMLEAVKMRRDDGELVWAVVRKGRIKALEDPDFEVTDVPTDPAIGIAHLDAAKCDRTGDFDYPVIYTDPDGRKHRLAWWQVITLEDMPSPEQGMNNVGFCAVSRVLKAAQILRDVAVYRQEKISGRFARRIYLTNVDPDDIRDRIVQAQSDADSAELSRYMQPIVAATIDPMAAPVVAAIDLASLPDGFDEDSLLRWYITELAMGTGVDYSFYAPITGGQLGAGKETEIGMRVSKGKSQRLFMETLQFKLNYGGVQPGSVRMRFKEIDREDEVQSEQAAQSRATTRAQMLANGEITPEVARQMAVDAGDLAARYLDLMGAEPTSEIEAEEPSEGEEPEAVDSATDETSEGPAPPAESTGKKAHGALTAGAKQDEDPQLRRQASYSFLLDKVNDYARRLLDQYDAWAAKWSKAIAAAPETTREQVILQAAEALDKFMIETAEADDGLREAYLLGLVGGTVPLEDIELEPIELPPEGQLSYEYYVDRNRGFVEWSLGPAVRDDLRRQPVAILTDAAAVAAVLAAYRARVTTYAGPYWALIWTGVGHAVEGLNLARVAAGILEPVPILRVLDPNAQHCGTCPDKAGLYTSWDEMIGLCGGVPGDGSDECGCNCRCWLIIGEAGATSLAGIAEEWLA